MKRRKLPIPYYWAILIGLTLGAVYGFKEYLMFLYWGETEYFSLRKHLWVPIVNFTLWGILSPLVYRLVVAYRINEGLRNRLRAILASVLISILHELLSNVMFYVPAHLTGYVVFGPQNMEFILGAFPSAVITRLIEYWILYAIFSAMEYWRMYRDKQVEYAQLETQLSTAQLNALRLQLQPHFLFNTLNTISALMELDVKWAQRIVSRLGNLLRNVLDSNKPQFVSLREEINFIRDYLDIEQARFQDRLKIDYHLDPEVMDALVPPLILQPLVENAIKHGFATSASQGTISVSAQRHNGFVRLSVQDDGQGARDAKAAMSHSGIGLKNVRERLELLYGDRGSFEVTTAPGSGFEVCLRIPNKASEV